MDSLGAIRAKHFGFVWMYLEVERQAFMCYWQSGQWLLSSCELNEDFHSEAGAKNWEKVSFIVFLNGVLQNPFCVLNIVSRSTWHQNAVDLVESLNE